MTIPAPGVAAFVNDVSTIGQSFLNWLRVQLQKAVDGTGGGTYTPSSLITIGGSGFAATISGLLALGATGRISVRTDESTLVNGDVSFRLSEALADIFVCTATLTTNRDWTISNSDAVEGELCLVVCDSTGAGRGNILNGSGTIAFFPGGGATVTASPWMWILLRRGASDWEGVCGHPDCFIA